MCVSTLLVMFNSFHSRDLLYWGESGGGIGFQVVMVLGTGSGEENGGEKKGGGGRRKYEI